MRHVLVALPLLLPSPALAGSFVYTPVHVAPVVHVAPMVHTAPVMRPAPVVRAAPAVRPAIAATPTHAHHHHVPIVVPVVLSTVQPKAKCAAPKPGDRACAKK